MRISYLSSGRVLFRSAMDCDPPFGMGQPLRCPAMVSTKAMAEDVSASNGIMLWATMPAHRPFAPRVRKRAAICFPDCKDFKPNCAKASGCCGTFNIGTQIWLSRSEEHTSELQSLMRTAYAVFCLKKTTCGLKHVIAWRK